MKSSEWKYNLKLFKSQNEQPLRIAVVAIWHWFEHFLSTVLVLPETHFKNPGINFPIFYFLDKTMRGANRMIPIYK